MGIRNLAKLIKEHHKVPEFPFANYSRKTVAVDASLTIYQFLVSVRNNYGDSFTGEDSSTSHIIGIFYRVISLTDRGLTPVFVFDGKPPELKQFAHAKRELQRQQAKEKQEKAEDDEEALKYKKRQVKITKEMIDDTKKLLDCMGVSYFDADGEAEKLCALMTKEKIVDCTMTEDMDTLCFGATRMMRVDNKKKTYELYELENILKDLKLNYKEFVDVCILMGCDYTKTLPGIGAKRAYEFIRKHKSIENILEVQKIEIEDFFFKECRQIFTEVEDFEKENYQVEKRALRKEDLKNFLVDEKKFNESRVVKAIEKYISARKKWRVSGLKKFFSVKK